jgi:predicted metalloprotease
MTFNDDSDISGSGVRRNKRSRGRTVGTAAGGTSILGLVVGLIILFANGGNLGDIFGDTSGGGGGSSAGSGVESDGTPLTECKTGADANKSADCLVVGAYKSLDAYWSTEADTLGFDYSSPQVDLFSDSVSTDCGSATSADGPFYCPSDQWIYLDTTFYDDLRTDYGASGGPLAELYVVAHEWGHHIQWLEGTFDSVDTSDEGAASNSVRTELQADCYAGAWVGDAATTEDENGETYLKPITKAQVTDALNAAAAIGDDRLQQESSGTVDKDTWTHGSSASRQKWFIAGYQGGPESCDTFSVKKSQL